MITLLSLTNFTGIYALSSDEWKSTQSWSETINSRRFGAFVPGFIHMEEHVIFKWHEQLYCSKVCCQSQWCLFFFSWISCSRYRFCSLCVDIFKVHIFWEGHKILRNLHQLFDWHYIGQIIGGDFAKFCGLLRIYELYEHTYFK